MSKPTVTRKPKPEATAGAPEMTAPGLKEVPMAFPVAEDKKSDFDVAVEGANQPLPQPEWAPNGAVEVTVEDAVELPERTKREMQRGAQALARN